MANTEKSGKQWQIVANSGKQRQTVANRGKQLSAQIKGWRLNAYLFQVSDEFIQKMAGKIYL